MLTILQEIYSKLFLAEGVSVSSVTDAIKGRYKVTINYKGDPKHGIAPGLRTIETYVYGLTKAGNPCIRAYQPYGDTASKVPSWKLFRLDRIISWKPTFGLITRPAPKFNPNGDGSMSKVFSIINFKTPVNTNNVDGPKQSFKQVGQLDNIDKILADREKEKQRNKDYNKVINTPTKPVLNKNMPEPVVNDKQTVIKPNQPQVKDGKLVDIEKILADREKEKQRQKDMYKTISKPTITKPTLVKPDEVPEPEIVDEPQTQVEPEINKNTPQEPETFKTSGDDLLNKFKDLNKRMDNAPIMDLSNRRFR